VIVPGVVHSGESDIAPPGLNNDREGTENYEGAVRRSTDKRSTASSLFSVTSHQLFGCGATKFDACETP